MNFAKTKVTLITIIILYLCMYLFLYLVEGVTRVEEKRPKEKVMSLTYDESFYNPPPMIETKERFTENERYLLAKIAMAEAEGESTKGKALVMQVILNRVSSDEFPDTIGEVIFQHNGDCYQFTTVKNGRIYKNEPNDDCWEALELIESGWDESKGALYFEAKTDIVFIDKYSQKLLAWG